MKLTKHIHSCLLVEENGEKLLIDPGIFTFSQGVPVETFKDVKTVILTHNHPDHLDSESLQKIIEMSGATIVANHEIKQALTKLDIATTIITDDRYTTEQFSVKAIPATHENILSDELPENYAYLINEKLLISGDSYAPNLSDIEEEIDTLFLPVTAPWTTELETYAFARSINPKRIIPAHDGYLKDFFQKARYDNYKKFFEKDGIIFEPLAKPGDSIEI